MTARRGEKWTHPILRAAFPPAQAHAADGVRIAGLPEEKAANTRPVLVRDGVLVVLALGACGYLLANLIAFQYGRDQGIYALVATRMLHGIAPYRGTWDFKPPGIYFVFALAEVLFGSSMYAVRILEAAGFASLIWACAVFSRRHVGSATAGVIGGALAILIHAQLEFWHTAQPGGFGAILLIWALVCATFEPTAADSRGALKQTAAWCAAGALYGCAALLKPPFGGGLLVSVAVVAYRRGRGGIALSRWQALRAPAAAMGLGAVLPVLLTVAYFLAKGAWSDLYAALFVFAPHYTALSFRVSWFPQLFLHALREWAFTFSAVAPVGLALLLLLPPLSPREREGMVHVAGLIAAVLVGVAIQAKFFPYHFDAALPLTALLAGWGFWKLWIRAHRQPLGVVAVLALVGILLQARSVTGDLLPDTFSARCRMRLAALLHPAARARINEHLYSVREVNSGANRRVAAWVDAETRPGDSVYVWGFEPVIYLLADRQPASRYIYDVPQRVSWGRDRARAALLADLRRSRPAVILVEHNDRFPWVTGDMLDSAGSLQRFPALLALLHTGYHSVGGIERFEIYVRDHQAAAASR